MKASEVLETLKRRFPNEPEYHQAVSEVLGTIEEVYNGEKYGVMSAALAEYLANGRPAEYDERTWVEMLIVKHALIAADKMKSEGDSISGMTDAESSSSYVRWNENDNA